MEAFQLGAWSTFWKTRISEKIMFKQ